MTHFSEEIVRGARTMYEAFEYGPAWDQYSQKAENLWCQAFSAGVAAMLPVSDAVCKVATLGYEPEAFAKEFTAAILSITSTGSAGR